MLPKTYLQLHCTNSLTLKQTEKKVKELLFVVYLFGW